MDQTANLLKHVVVTTACEVSNFQDLGFFSHIDGCLEIPVKILQLAKSGKFPLGCFSDSSFFCNLFFQHILRFFRQRVTENIKMTIIRKNDGETNFFTEKTLSSC